MKITSIDVYDFGKCLNYEDCSPICIRINTDAGISGFGEVGLAYGNAHNAGVWMVKKMPLITGGLPMVILHPNGNQCRCGIKIDDVFLPHINDLPPCNRHNKIQYKKQHDIKISEICSSALMIHSILKIVVKPDERC